MALYETSIILSLYMFRYKQVVVTDDYDSNERKNCQQHYLQPLSSMSQYFQFSKTAIIRTDSHCDEMSAKELLIQLRSNISNNSGVSSVMDFVVRLEHLSEDISEFVYQVKTTGVDFIICLISSTTTEILFEMASSYELLDYSTTWLTIEQHNQLAHLQTKKLPWQWIDLRLSRRDLKWESMAETLIAVAEANLTR